ncbi:hypothetical protein Tco_1569481 [Tanacetum coccineum]
MMKGLEKIDHDDFLEMDLKWKVLIILRLMPLTVIEGAICLGNVGHQESREQEWEDAGIGSRDNTKRSVPVETSVDLLFG